MSETGLEIAVIGMSGRFPGARNIHEFWENLKNGVESLGFYTEEELESAGVDAELLKNPYYVKAGGGILEDVEYFDAGFFDYVPSEAVVMHPQIRIFHECAWEALEHAGYDPGTYDKKIGIYAGASSSLNWENLVTLSGKAQEVGRFASASLANSNFLSTRIAYKLNLKGPGFTLQTACSTSLVTIDQACRGILTGQCNIALAGGVSISTKRNRGYLYKEGMIQSPDGHCRAFDARAKGTISGEGIGIVVLKLLEDAISEGDTIYAVIKGSATNNDGNRKVGYTAPSIEGQAEVIRAAHLMAEVEPESITYIETHGTGTPLGDPVEIEALKQGFATDKKGFCKIGSAKTNIGHLDAAAGIASFIKVVLALTHRQIPPGLHFETPNPKVDFKNSPFCVNTTLIEWKNDKYPLRAGVSSFGIGGTNAHVVLEEFPRRTKGLAPLPDQPSRKYQLILLSAKSQPALEKMTENLAEFLEKNPGTSLADAAFTLQAGRGVFRHRRMMVCSTNEETLETLSNPASGKMKTFCTHQENQNPALVFMFPGQGSQYVNMGWELYQKEPVFREGMDRCFEILKPLMGHDIKEILYPGDLVSKESSSVSSVSSVAKNIDQTEIAQLLIFTIEYALAKLLIQWDIKPSAMMGYSFGEYVAACVSGVFSLKDALKLVVSRGRLIQKVKPGAMLSVPLSRQDLTPLLDSNPELELSLAIDNGPSCIVAGSNEAVDAFEKQLKEKKFLCMRLPVSHAIHSPMMSLIREEFQEVVGSFTLQKPQIPYVSNVTGNWIRADQAVDPAYWATHLRQTVRFAEGLNVLVNKWENALFLEIGPGRDLSALVVRYIQHNPAQRIINLMRHPQKDVSDIYWLLNQMGRLWFNGIKPNWPGFHHGKKRQRIPLPTYPFDRDHYPARGDLPDTGMNKLSLHLSLNKKPDKADWFYIPSWKRSLILFSDIVPPSTRSCWLMFADTCGLGSQLAKQLRDRNQTVVVVKQGDEFSKKNNLEYTINPQQVPDYNTLLAELRADANIPDKIIHLWSVTSEDETLSGIEAFDRVQELGLYSLISLAKAIENLDISSDFEIVVISNNTQEVTGKENLCPEKSTVFAPIKVIPQEYPYIRCRSLDIILPEPGSSHEKKMVKQLAAELFFKSADTVIAYRDDYRWVQTFEPIRLEEVPGNIPRLKKGGVYLITGGLGRIGLTLARYLAETVQAKLILTGRSPFPDRKEWDEWLSNHEKNNGVAIKIRRIKELEKLGAKILIFNVDAANQKEMERMVLLSEEQLGPINGVIHAAGVLRGGTSFNTINKLDQSAFEEQFQAKVYALLVLEGILEHRKLDFCLLTSSLSPILGGLRFAAYSAANQFMDAFVYKHNRENPGGWISLNWGDWQTREEAKQETTIGTALNQLNMSPDEGIETFRRVLYHCDTNQVIISSGDLQVRIDQWVKLKTLRQQDNIHKKQPTTFYRQSYISGSYVKPRTRLEQDLVNIWQGLFGYDRIGIHDDFLELGGDSLKAITVISAIHKQLKVQIPLPDFFNHPTVEKLAGYIKGELTPSSAYTAVPTAEKKDYYLLSPAQKRLYILQQIDSESTAYNEVQAVVIQDLLDWKKLENIFQRLIQRHDCYRTSIIVVEGEPVQRIHAPADVEFAVEKPEIPAANGNIDNHVNEMIGDFIRPFDLSRPPFLRAALIKTGNRQHILVVDMHHIVTDGVSQQIFVKEMAALYAGKELPSLRVRYKDYAQWLNLPQQQVILANQAAYWLEQFQDGIPVLNLPLDNPRPPLQEITGTRTGFEISKGETDALKHLAAKQGTTLYVMLLAAFNVMLAKICSQEDIVIGTPTAGRRHADLEQITGMFVNTLALRNYPGPGEIFTRFLHQVKDNTLKAFDNQDYPFEELVEQVPVNREVNRNPLFDVMFVMQNVDVQQAENLDLSLKPYRYKRKISRFDLTLQAFEINKQLKFTLEYCTKLFKAETIKRFIGYFKKIISSVLENPVRKISEIEIIPGEEKAWILFDFNNTAAGFPGDKTIHELFVRQVERTPDHVALVGQITNYKLQITNKAEPFGQVLYAFG
ncbi:MAG: acyltransferase domain-containing protein, partial [Candidatus Aminicenantes bacterium]